MALSQTRTKLIRRLSDRKGRARETAVLVEGVRSAEAVLESGLEIRFAVVAPRLGTTDRGRNLLETLDGSAVESQEVSDRDLRACAATEHSQGVLLVCAEPQAWTFPATGVCDGPLLVADGIQDPGNMGTLIRSARAFGFEAVILLDGTVDPWSPKVVRSSAGALFHIGLCAAPWGTVAAALRSNDIDLYAGVPHGAPVSEIGGIPSAPWGLVIGNEGNGVRPNILEYGVKEICVPMQEGSESLNAAVAGAILMYVLAGSRC